MKTSEILGKKVIDKNAYEVGKVHDFDLDTKKWSINGIYVSSGILGSDFRVSIDEVDKIGDFIILKIEKKK
ncbi:MAG: PRC-barrel domain-containing protein [Methanobacterium sp.]|uniref:PRC-barrel domain-containing protein n=1 Tax=Methanobacterium sp. TaxID=2164 RepID=UPI003D6593D8|nr:PRC-barrel domain-containing protein [Methanobacterium sp.]